MKRLIEQREEQLRWYEKVKATWRPKRDTRQKYFNQMIEEGKQRDKTNAERVV